MMVMLLKKFVVEYGLYNGAMGRIKKIVFPDKDGSQKNTQLGYAIAEFERSTIPEDDKLIPGMPRTYVPVPVTEST